MRKSVKDFVRICAASVPIHGPVFEFGSLQVKGQEGFADLRPYFSGKKYIGCDLVKGAGVDQILDAQKTGLPDESIGTAICCDTLEHVEDFFSVFKEMYRILSSNGVLIVSTVMNFSIHEYPRDFWRFTPGGIDYLLKEFPLRFVVSAGAKENPHTVVGIGIKNKDVQTYSLKANLAVWEKRWFVKNQ